jgi:hypothetical protein
MGLPTFWVEKTNVYDWTAEAWAKGPCPTLGDEHRAESEAVTVEGALTGHGGRLVAPTACACGYVFGADAARFSSGRPRWRRRDTGEELRGKLQPGALYVAEPAKDNDGWEYTGADGLNVICVLPDGTHWYIDSRANNCTMPADTVHRCWVRHGTLDGSIHVDKNGNTCAAGAGSIATSRYHGFLHNGELTSC